MIARFDHAVIAVGNLGRAVESYGKLGFGVAAGGRHDRRGTHNAIVRFGADYLELLGVYDPEQAVGSGPNGRALAEFVRDRDGGLVGQAFATDDIEAEAGRLRGAGLDLVGPFAMRRELPDGRALTWRLLVPIDVPWRRPWPFFIQWDQPDDERLLVEEPGVHPNGARSVSGVAVTLRNLEQVVRLYSTLFDSPPVRTDDVSRLSAVRARFDVHGFVVDLLAPAEEGPIEDEISKVGEGLFEVRIKVADLGVAGEVLGNAGVEVTEDAGGLRVPARSALGARLLFVEPS